MGAIPILEWIAMGLVLLLAVLAVHLRDLLMGALALAVMSAILAALFFHFGAPWAGAFELSVCAASSPCSSSR